MIRIHTKQYGAMIWDEVYCGTDKRIAWDMFLESFQNIEVHGIRVTINDAQMFLCEWIQTEHDKEVDET